MRFKMIALRPGAVTRLRGKMSKAELAREAGVSRTTVFRIEEGELASVTFDTVNRLAKALKCDADMLVTFDPR